MSCLPTSRISIQPSRLAQALVLAMHCLAGLGLCLTALPAGLVGLGQVPLLLSAWWHWHAGGALAGKRLLAVTLTRDYCLLHWVGRRQFAHPPQAEYISACLLVLRLTVPGQRRPLRLSLWPDSLSREDDWRVRCYLLAQDSLPG